MKTTTNVTDLEQVKVKARVRARVRVSLSQIGRMATMFNKFQRSSKGKSNGQG